MICFTLTCDSFATPRRALFALFFFFPPFFTSPVGPTNGALIMGHILYLTPVAGWDILGLGAGGYLVPKAPK